ncbi:hypothetical protein D3C86_1984050 [compost metagenome]
MILCLTISRRTFDDRISDPPRTAIGAGDLFDYYTYLSSNSCGSRRADPDDAVSGTFTGSLQAASA